MKSRSAFSTVLAFVSIFAIVVATGSLFAEEIPQMPDYMGEGWNDANTQTFPVLYKGEKKVLTINVRYATSEDKTEATGVNLFADPGTTDKNWFAAVITVKTDTVQISIFEWKDNQWEFVRDASSESPEQILKSLNIEYDLPSPDSN